MLRSSIQHGFGACVSITPSTALTKPNHLVKLTPKAALLVLFSRFVPNGAAYRRR